MRLTKLAYASHHGGVDKKSLDDIMISSRRNNERDNITGVLISGEEDFMQYIEGGHTVIAKCFMRIMQDIRHQHIRILFAGAAEFRVCPQWTLQEVKESSREERIISQYWIGGKFDPDEMF